MAGRVQVPLILETPTWPHGLIPDQSITYLYGRDVTDALSLGALDVLTAAFLSGT